MKATTRTSIRTLLLLLVCVHVSQCVNVEINKWVKISDMPSTIKPQYGTTMYTSSQDGGVVTIFGKPWDQWVNHMWQYNIGSNQWTQLSSSAKSLPIWFGDGTLVPGKDNASNPELYLFGGVANGGINPNTGIISANIQNQLNKWNAATNQFESVSVSGDVKGRRQSSSSVHYNGDMYTIGGCFENEQLYDIIEDTWKFDVSTRRWTQLSPNFIIPPIGANDTQPTTTGRCGHSAVLIESQKTILMFGGHAGGGFIADLWAYSIENNTWTYIVPEGFARPEGRTYHGAVVIDDVMVIFGGDGKGTSHLDDMWAYSPVHNKWLMLSPLGAAGGQQKPVNRAHLSAGIVTNQMYIYGGLTHDSQGSNVFLDDLWVYGIGCANNCSGRGTCYKSTVCICDGNCTGGADCSVDLCTTEPVTETTPKTKDIVLWLILAIAGAVFIVLVLAGVAAVVIVRKFRQWKLREQQKEQEKKENFF